MKGQNFARQVLSRHTFRISRKKGNDLFDHKGTLKPPNLASRNIGLVVVHNLSTAVIKLVFQIRAIDRKQEVPHDGPMCDLLWSDPEGIPLLLINNQVMNPTVSH